MNINRHTCAIGIEICCSCASFGKPQSLIHIYICKVSFSNYEIHLKRTSCSSSERARRGVVVEQLRLVLRLKHAHCELAFLVIGHHKRLLELRLLDNKRSVVQRNNFFVFFFFIVLRLYFFFCHSRVFAVFLILNFVYFHC